MGTVKKGILGEFPGIRNCCRKQFGKASATTLSSDKSQESPHFASKKPSHKIYV